MGSSSLCLVKWMNCGSIIIVSNMIRRGEVKELKKWCKNKVEVPVRQPEAIAVYNRFMGGVDKLNRMVLYYRVFIRSRKYPLRFVFHLIALVVLKSWLEYTEFQKAQKSKNSGFPGVPSKGGRVSDY
ncbi:hypothetical protein QYM36_001168 [Artemia franciscana]|uniref:PiggyBac transposable element-derived protein domain-containing protein n=1 Tax=Artemia franciscana TaxID=6661 RepID=A0AA88IMP3_ARTSF|nr:hypothetical protein QYM36_001168 [Artemia franciscana]